MKMSLAVAASVGCLALGVCIGLVAKSKEPGIDLVRGKPPKEAGAAALMEAEKLAGHGTWELLGVARVYYLSGDKAKGQALIDQVVNGKNDPGDWTRIGWVYADAGENTKAAYWFDKATTAEPKDDTGEAEVGGWYIRIGERDKGEALLAKAFAKHPDEMWHYVRAAEGFLGVPAR
ncbi:MAG TPA: hypothetical protein VMG11_13055 [Steroidobacteraceae bacterium]|nr:hypothetical protein [Steroidobacteraceae bacterium]